MISNLQAAKKIHSNIVQAQNYLLDLERFIHAKTLRGLLYDLDCSYSEFHIVHCPDEIKIELGNRGVKYKFHTIKLYLISYCLKKIRQLMTEHWLNLSFLKEGDVFPFDGLDLFTPEFDEWTQFKEIEVAIDELLPVMTVDKAKEVANFQRTIWKSPAPYVLDAIELDNLTKQLRSRRGDLVRWIRNCSDEK